MREAADEIGRHAETDFSLEFGFVHRRPDLVIVADKAARLNDKALARWRQLQALAVAFEEGAAETVFEPLHLLAYGCLCEVEYLGRTGHPAGVDHGQECSQQRDIDVVWHKNFLSRP
ncbi:hypothetical protein HNQ95_000291 [Aminobacter ciceronei]|uniref:Uncharacterized protein n=1 Tax=Aminobacter ciceronei TaxID=150723 RepID=A0ABR6C0L6_9HYPH|nr:hypothetical protein [Aminobacter ciceronei]MBA8904528.1 hypothetical protein [Aminobacter ciceronei]MBA9018306.1 hypothetical protein [Aminobacter ciceronei]